jgi:hypothetical protein
MLHLIQNVGCVGTIWCKMYKLRDFGVKQFPPRLI